VEFTLIAPGDIISYIAMCQAEGVSLQRGMNYRLRGTQSVILMSIRKGAPYQDQVLENGTVLIYEGHDIASRKGVPNPKRVDQPFSLPSGKMTQNGLFFEAAQRAKVGASPPEVVRVYEKIRDGIWAYNGTFELVDGWKERSGPRQVFRFKLVLRRNVDPDLPQISSDLQHNRLIPSAVKLEVWKRDRGRCVICGSQDNLHFDHDFPFSKGGTSLLSKNIRLLCARHNLQKSDKIE
jgi:hypothetical protein